MCLYGELVAAAAAVVPFVGVWGNLEQNVAPWQSTRFGTS
jgi:hypothetical protein